MENELDILVEEILQKVNFENTSELKKRLVKLYSLIKTDPSLLSIIKNPAGLGKCFVLMLNNSVTNDDDIIEAIACMGYTVLSMAISRNDNINVVLDRLVLIELSREQFKHSLRGALRKKGVVEDIFTFGDFLELKNRDNLYKMEIYDLYSNPIIYQQIDIFKDKKLEFDGMIEGDFFNTKSLETLISQGRENHEKAYNYFYDKIIINHDIEV